jgi:lysozyme family protein
MGNSVNTHPKWSKEWIIADKTAVEAGYVDHPSDPGGETNCGITREVAERNKADLVKLFRWDGKMRSLTKEMAYYIYDKDYWKAMYLDEVHKRCPFIADKMFDIGINIGTGRAEPWLQTFLTTMNRQGKDFPDLKIDGQIGPTSLAALDAFMKVRGNKPARWTVLKGLLCFQGSHYVNISVTNGKLEDFTFGWFERMEHNLAEYHQALRAS